MAYQALYRVWRPQRFFDVVGQEHVTTTLQNALLQDKISHAYLFSGPRGTGKTSAAKILAKAVNCEKSPVREPCNECPSCRGITDGSIPDVIEIDAASNNGVEEIRDIRDKVKYAPNAVKYKVYIIDEVHMLSIGAFNALLKTLEEPPRHVIFILATTEPHKIPLTIISRTQRFDFKRITSNAIVGRMKWIVEETGVQCDEQALHVIARAAEGGMRDALSLLDQAISFSQDQVTVEDALTVTGSVSQSFLSKLGWAIKEKNPAAGLEALEELLQSGKDPARFIEDMIYFYRDMLLYKAAPGMEDSLERVLIDDDFKQLVSETETADIYNIIDGLNKTQQEMKWTNHPRVFLEVAVVRLCQLEAPAGGGVEAGPLLQRIEQLEERLARYEQHPPAGGQGESPAQKKPARTNRKGFQAPAGKINEVLKMATKQDLQNVKSKWGSLREKLIERQMRSQAALLTEAEPVASSETTLVIKFKYEIHCQMAMENERFIMTVSSILGELTGKQLQIVGVPEDQWHKIRENFINTQHSHNEQGAAQSSEEDPLISEAKKLFGEELIQVED